MPDKKENGTDNYKFGKWEMAPGRYTITLGREESIKIDLATKQRVVIPKLPPFTVLVNKFLTIDLDSPEYAEQPEENLALAAEKFKAMGAIELTPELQKIRKDKADEVEKAQKTLKRAEEAEKLVINKQQLERKKKGPKVKEMGTL